MNQWLTRQFRMSLPADAGRGCNSWRRATIGSMRAARGNNHTSAATPQIITETRVDMEVMVTERGETLEDSK
jgi:hypothetical protein